MTPYYRSPDGSIVVYHASIEALLASGVVPIEEVALVHGDPPYGVSLHLTARRGRRKTLGTGNPKLREYLPIAGDDRSYDPEPILALDRRTVLWGANHYSDKLPASPSWLEWDKCEAFEPTTGADMELAWSNLGGPARRFSHYWRGVLRASELHDVHLYPAQKPVALMLWIFAERAKLKPGDLVLVPYMGSGPEIEAAVKLGLRVIACDVSEEACRIACSARLGVVPRPEQAEKLGPLFAGRVAP